MSKVENLLSRQDGIVRQITENKFFEFLDEMKNILTHVDCYFLHLGKQFTDQMLAMNLHFIGYKLHKQMKDTTSTASPTRANGSATKRDISAFRVRIILSYQKIMTFNY